MQLTLRCSRTPSATGRATSLHLVTADWGEGASNSGNPGGTGGAAAPGDATWTHRIYPTTLWTTAGGDFAAGASATTSVGAIAFYSWKAAQMKSDVQAWLDTPANNFGWVIIGDESVSRSARRLDSRENPTPASRPALKVFYTIH